MIEEKRRTMVTQAANTGNTHQLTLVDRGHLSLEGARNVVSFSPEEILVETTGGALAIRGEDLHIQQLNLDDGRLVVDGSFASLAYLGEGFGKKGKNLLGRLLR